MARKPDRRSERTENDLMDAMVALIVEKDYGKITVSEIARRAGVDRTTFYQHYTSKDDLVLAVERRRVAKLMETFGPSLESDHPVSREMLRQALLVLMDQDACLDRRIALTPSYDFLLADAKRLLSRLARKALKAGSDLDERHAALCAEFCAAGMLAGYVEWIRSGETIPVEQLVSTLTDLVFQGIEGAVGQAQA